MVHALQQAAALVKPGGRFIDIHPHPAEPDILVRLGDEEQRAGWLYEHDERVEYAQADAALETAVARGLFRVARRETFVFNTYADSVADLRAYLAENWTDARLDEPVARRAEELLRAPQPGEIVLRERVRIARLRVGGEWDTDERG
ncbi:MAG: hypothetical protein KC425_12190 [Anaerolineales bacterium]|nr:hypothetical protein [Anaerolineales bacterium]